MPFGAELLRIRLEGEIPFHDRHAVPEFGDAVHVHAQREPVEELRAQVALLRVHRADQDEAGGMGEGDAFALDDVHAAGGRIQEDVDNVVVEQVDFIDVEEAAVGGGEHARFVTALAFLDGPFDVERANHPVFRGGNRQVDERGAAFFHRQGFSAGGPLTAFGAPGGRPVRIADEAASGDGANLRKQGGQGPCRGGFGRAAFAADEHPADAWVNGIKQERALHAFLAGDCGEGKNIAHRCLKKEIIPPVRRGF